MLILKLKLGYNERDIVLGVKNTSQNNYSNLILIKYVLRKKLYLSLVAHQIGT